MRLKYLVPALASAALLLITAPAFAAPLDSPWTGEGGDVYGFETGTVVSDGSSGIAEFQYEDVGSGAWEFRATAQTARSLPLSYRYEGFHAFFHVSVALSRFVIRDGVEINSQSLVNDFAEECCSPPSGGFSYHGQTTFDLQTGDVYGFRMSGSNGDSDNRLNGRFTLSPDSTPPDVAAAVEGTRGDDGWYTSDATVHWTTTDAESAISATSGCEDAAVTSDTAGRTFTCSATSAGGTTTRSVTIKRDATAPRVTVPESRTAEATGPDGATVGYDASATDALDDSPVLSCSPASGSTFRAGDTTVTCTAVDAAGNAASKAFTVHVKGASEQIADASSAITASSLLSETAKSAAKLLDQATSALAAGDKSAACGKLGAVKNKIQAKSGKDIATPDAASLSADIDRIKAVANC